MNIWYFCWEWIIGNSSPIIYSFFLLIVCQSCKIWFPGLFLSLLISSTNLSTNLPGQPGNRSPRIKSSIFVVWELRDYNKMLEKADMKSYWFWLSCTKHKVVKINNSSCRPFLRRRLLVATKSTNIDDLILRLRLFTHPGKFLFSLWYSCFLQIWYEGKFP